MTTDYVTQIIRAAGTLRSGDPAGVTALVQNALALAGLAQTNDSRATPPFPQALPLDPGRAAHRPVQPGRLRKPLGEVVRVMRDIKMGQALAGLPGRAHPAAAPEPALPPGALFLEDRYACTAGARRYRLYVPSTVSEGVQGLVVMLHGCTQTPEDFAAGTGMNALAEEHRLLVVYPAQTSGDNSMSCWNWFRPGDQVRDAGEPAIIAGLTERLRDQYAVPVDRVFVAGLSAGGAMAVIMGETYPDMYGAVGVHSGLAYGSANDVISAFAAMRGQPAPLPPRTSSGAGRRAGPRMIVFQGSADTTVHPSNADRIIAGGGGGAGRLVPIASEARGTRAYTRRVARRADGSHAIESWTIEGAPHAWSGGHPGGSYTDPRGPDASAAMVRFFLHGTADLPKS